MRAMVMAAGRGTRLAPLTDILPKMVMPVGNEPVMGHLLRQLARHGLRDIVSNIWYLSDIMEQVFGDGTAYGTRLTWSREQHLMGTAGGVKRAQSLLIDRDEPVLITSGDGLHDVDFTAVIRQHRESEALVSIVVKPVEDPSQYGVLVTDEDGWVTSFQEKPGPDTALSNLCNTGIYVLQPEVFERIPSDREYDFGSELFPLLVSERERVLAVVHDGYWNDIGGLAAYREGNIALVEGQLRNSDRAENCQLVAPTANVADERSLLGSCVVGPGASVPATASVAASVVLPGAEVPEGAMLAAAVYGSRSGLEQWLVGFSS